MKKNKSFSGFTLIELLIAISIFSVISLSLFSVFQSGILCNKKINSTLQADQNARILFNRIELDLRNAFKFIEIDSEGPKLESSKFIGKENYLEFFSLIDSYSRAKSQTDICRIKYELVEKVLSRYCYKGIDSLNNKIEQEADLQCPGVLLLTFSYAYPTHKPFTPYEWAKEWGKDFSKPPLPLAVKIHLIIEDDQHKTSVEFNKFVGLALN